MLRTTKLSNTKLRNTKLSAAILLLFHFSNVLLLLSLDVTQRIIILCQQAVCASSCKMPYFEYFISQEMNNSCTTRLRLSLILRLAVLGLFFLFYLKKKQDIAGSYRRSLCRTFMYCFNVIYVPVFARARSQRFSV